MVLIGERWSAITDKAGKRRLDDPADYVSREIAAALKSKVPVRPVLIGDATMPRTDELPETLSELTRRNAMTLTDERWDFDVTRLAKVLAIDVPGSVAQRKLNLLQSLALLLLFASGTLATVVFCKAVNGWGGRGARSCSGTPDLPPLSPLFRSSQSCWRARWHLLLRP
jgi:hypothetical protein